VQLGIECFANLITGWNGRVVHGGVETTFAVNTVERTDFSINRQQVYTQRKSQSTAVDGSENYLVEKNHLYWSIVYSQKSTDLVLQLISRSKYQRS